MDRADSRARQHRNRCFRNGREINNDAVAFADFVPLQNVGESANLAMQLLISEGAFLARLTFPQNCRLVAAVGGEMSVETVLRKIDLSANEPFRKRCLPFQNFPPWLLPGQLLRF